MATRQGPRIPRERPASATQLRLARLAASMTQVELAGASGVAQNRISEYELGKFSPSPRQLARLLDAIKAAAR